MFKKVVLQNGDVVRVFRSSDFNFNFNMNNGRTEVWGKTLDDDPEFAPFPLICDFEITTICNGILGTPCKFCYKSNTPKGEYIPFEKAKLVIDKLPDSITQIAFGTDATLQSNPDWERIFRYAREKGIIPNVTVANLDDETAKKVASICGAAAVSFYDNKDVCYGTVKKLSDAGLKQVNIHRMISEETFEGTLDLIADAKKDERLSGLNAIVFLSLKQKGRGRGFHRLSQEKFSLLVNACIENDISFGFDSCSATKFMRHIQGTPHEGLKTFVEPCESFGIMSMYINVHGEYFPCSFSEGCPGWEKGFDILSCNDFVEDIWNSPKLAYYRELSLMHNRACLFYNV